MKNCHGKSIPGFVGFAAAAAPAAAAPYAADAPAARGDAGGMEMTARAVRGPGCGRKSFCDKFRIGIK